MITFCKDKFEEKLFKEVSFFEGNGKDQDNNFLVWFLVNYYRIDENLAVDMCCDHKNDKGIDGIYIDNETKEIILIQAKYRKCFKQSEGSTSLKQLIGSGEQFNKKENIEILLASKISKELKDLIISNKIIDLIGSGYEIKMIFITTGFFNKDALNFMATSGHVEYWDNNELFKKYSYNGGEDIVNGKHKLTSIDNISKYEYKPGKFTYFLPIKCKDLLELDGIIDRTLFSKNVRFGLGKTKVNRAIKKTIIDQKEHKNFILFHNGITLVSHSIKLIDNKNIEIENYSIVNGCQSTLTLYENKDLLSNNLNIFLKVVETGENTKLSDEITYYANNQNSISESDLKSRDKFQMDLQKDFNGKYKDTLFYSIKPGEDLPKGIQEINKTYAAQLIHSFKNDSPQNAHMKNQVFNNYYEKIFTRHVNAELIYFLNVLLKDIIEKEIEIIKIKTVRSYQPVKFFMIYLIKNIMKSDPVGMEFFKDNKLFLNTYNSKINSSFTEIVKMCFTQLNSELDIISKKESDISVKGEAEIYIDYKNIFRNKSEIDKLNSNIISFYNAFINHIPTASLGSLLNKD